MIDYGLRGKVALVTGGNNPHGIGAAIAKALAAHGAEVFIHYFRQTSHHRTAAKAKSGEPPVPGLEFYYAMQAKSADEVVHAIRDSGGRAESWEANLRDPAVIPELFGRAEDAFGPVDVVVNNAADYEADTFLPKKLLQQGQEALWPEGPETSTITAESHDRHFDVNARAVALMTAEFAGRHIARKRRWGRIVNVSADCSEGSPGEISYRASKHALESYSRSAAAELGPLGITVNVVSPGPVQTGYISKEIEEQLLKSIPLRRVGRPETLLPLSSFWLRSKPPGSPVSSSLFTAGTVCPPGFDRRSPCVRVRNTPVKSGPGIHLLRQVLRLRSGRRAGPLTGLSRSRPLLS